MAKQFHIDNGIVRYVVFGGTRIRQYVIPANPRTSSQQQHRGGFKLSTRVASSSLDLFINDLWSSVKISMSPYHSFLSVNGSLANDLDDFDKLLMTVGEYEPIKEIVSVKYKDAMGRIVYRWSGDVVADGDPDDRVILFAIDTTFWNASTNFSLLKIYIQYGKLRKNRSGFVIPLDIPLSASIKAYISVLTPVGVSPVRMSVSKFKQCEGF